MVLIAIVLIPVVKGGDVIESGSHEKLMQRGGFYCQLYQSQYEFEEAAG